MKSRQEAARFIEAQFDDRAPNVKDKTAWHYGKAELRRLMDFLYGGPPAEASEALFVWKGPLGTVASAPLVTEHTADLESSVVAVGEETALHVELNFDGKPPPKCKHCGRDKARHSAGTLNCPSGRGNFPSFLAGQTYEPRKPRKAAGAKSAAAEQHT